MKYLVYITGLRGPEPQIWSEKDMYRDQKLIPTLMKVELSDADMRMRIKDLMEKYPYVEPVEPLVDKNA